MYAGVDVGAAGVVCVSLDRESRVDEARTFTAAAEAAEWAVKHEVVCIDAPAQTSRGAHVPADGLSRTFSEARCAEIALGRDYGIWVPWVTPVEPPASGWMAVGLELFQAMEASGAHAAEVFPYGIFRLLAGEAKLPKKSTLVGLHARRQLLEAAGASGPHLAAWSHDAIDALAGAVVARDIANGTARRATCGHDDSAIWLPAPPT